MTALLPFLRQLAASLRMLLCSPSCSASPTRWRVTGFAQVVVPGRADGQLAGAPGRPTAVGSALLGQSFDGDGLLPAPALGRRRRLRPAGLRRLEPRARRAPSSSTVEERRAAVAERRRGRRRRPCRRRGHGQRLRAGPAHLARSTPRSRWPGSPRRGAWTRAPCAASSRSTSRAGSLGFIGEPRVNVLQLNLALAGHVLTAA